MVIFITENKMCCNKNIFISLVMSCNIKIKLKIYFKKYLKHTIIFSRK